MGNRKRVIASISGAAALIVAPFIHNAFSVAAANGASNDSLHASSTSTNDNTSTTSTTSAKPAVAADSTDNANADKDQGTMPVSVHTEISNGQTNVTVNGEPIDVPASGSVQKTVSDNNSTTSINIQTDGTDGSANTTTRTTGGTTHVSSRTSSNVSISTTNRSTDR